MRCPRCRKLICDCLLEDPEYLARAVGKQLSRLSGSEALCLTTKKNGVAVKAAEQGPGEDPPQNNGEASDEYYTPPEAIDILIPYLQKTKTIWEAAWGQGHMAKHLKQKGYKVVGEEGLDFFQTELHSDTIITNPPYSIKNEFLQRAYELKRPFALLLPLEALCGLARYPLYKQFGIQLLVPSTRIQFIGNNTTSCYFNTAWFCWRILPQDLMFASLGRERDRG